MNILIALLIIIILYLCLSTVYSKNWNKGLSIDVHFNENIITENDTAHLTEVIENRNFLPIPTLWVKFAVHRSLDFKDKENISTSDKCYKNDIFSIYFYQRITKNLTFTAKKRGFFKIDSIDIVASNLIFSDSLVSSVPCDTTLMVYPRLTDTKRMSIPFRQIMGEISSNRFSYEDPFEFSRIRQYTSGDSLKDINWKATAKTGSLKTNVHAHTIKQEVCFLYNPELDGMLEDDDIREESIRIIATLAAMLTKESISFSFSSSAADIITHEGSSLSSGMGRQHLNDLFKVLARIDLTATSTTAAANRTDFNKFAASLINSNKKNATTVILVSAEKGTKIQQLFKSLYNNKNISAFWLLPLYKSELSTAPNVPNVFPWEVKY